MVTIKRVRERVRMATRTMRLTGDDLVFSKFCLLEDLLDLEDYGPIGSADASWSAWVVGWLYYLTTRFVLLVLTQLALGPAGPVMVVLALLWSWHLKRDMLDPSPVLAAIVDRSCALASEDLENLDSSQEETESGHKAGQRRRRRKAPLIAHFVTEAKLRFGTPRMTAANHRAVRRYIMGQMAKPEHHIRKSDQVAILDTVTAATFVPSQTEVAAAAALDNVDVMLRQAEYQDTRLGSLSQ